MMRHMYKSYFLFSLFSLLCACNHQPDRANVLLITIDTLRADHLGCYGYERGTSPNLDRFAEESVKFENVYCPLPATAPSHASIFSSLYPHKHGVVANGWVLAEHHTTLAEIFKRNGYMAAAFVSSFPVDSRFGLDQGFDLYDDRFDKAEATTSHIRQWAGHEIKEGFDRRAGITAAKAVEWLKSHAQKPFFLWVHFFDPHAPYDPPKPFDTLFIENTDTPMERIIARYDGEIRFVDREIRRLLDGIDTLELKDNTLSIITSDHGEGLGQHNWMAHGVYIYEEQMRLPLLIRFPGKIPPGKRIEAPIQSIDIAPTLLSLLNLSPPEAFQGRDLSSWILSETKSDEPADIYFERMHYHGRSDYFSKTQYQLTKTDDITITGEKIGVIHNRMKFIWAPEENTEELYDLEKDPGEMVNLADTATKESMGKFKEILNRWLRANPFSEELQEPDNEFRRKLEVLGYVD